jgi:predicted alpha/beta hydrolase
VGIYALQMFAQRLAAFDLQPPLFRVLNMVDEAEGQSRQAIGHAIGAPASGMVANRRRAGAASTPA